MNNYSIYLDSSDFKIRLIFLVPRIWVHPIINTILYKNPHSIRTSIKQFQYGIL